MSRRYRVWADVTGDDNVWVPISDHFRVRGAAEGWAAHLYVGAWRIDTEEPEEEDPRCSVCRSVCRWVDDAWVCTGKDCGAEWYPDHDGPAFAPPGEEPR